MGTYLAPAGGEVVATLEGWAVDHGLRFDHHPVLGDGAVLSACGRYRYLLWRMYDQSSQMLGMAMLNPSTADHMQDDPTIRRCRSRVHQAQLGGLLVWNLFAVRATDPAVMKAASDPIGLENEAATDLALQLTRRTLAAWGTDGGYRGRNAQVLRRCAAAGVKLEALGLTKDGHPRHPLYMPDRAAPSSWDFTW